MRKNMRENRGFLNILVSLFLLFLLAGIGTQAAGAREMDELSGLAWEDLLKGEIPDGLFWEFVNPQRDYLRKTFGRNISTTYELYSAEMDRLGRAGQPTEDPRVSEKKTLKRWPDHVVVHGFAFPGWKGRSLDHLRVYACRLGKFVPIPYQFDEFTAEGVKVLPDGGPEANPGDGNRVLDDQDEFLFMAHDLGDRVDPHQWIQGFEDVQEIAVEDPLDGGQGWCYFFLFPGDPPARSPLDYVTYIEKYNQQISFYVLDQAAFKVIGGKLYRQIFPHVVKIPDYAGGNFTNFVDRMKYRARVRLLFGSIKITVTEDQFTGHTLALRDGPVRCTRRVSGRIRLPMGFKTPEILGEITQFDTFFLVPTELKVPFNPGLVLTDLTMYSGTELRSSANGSRWYNSNNLSGFLVDGKSTQDEKDMNDAVEQWRLATGPWGTMMNRSLWDPEFKRQSEIRIRFTDAIDLPDPPEYEPGQIGMAYSYTKVKDIEPRTYALELDWFFPPWFNTSPRTYGLNMDKVKAYMDMYDNPLKIFSGTGWYLNDPVARGAQERKQPDKTKKLVLPGM
jgi:hypothetical protein